MNLDLRYQGELDDSLHPFGDGGVVLPTAFVDEFDRVKSLLISEHRGYLDEVVSFLQSPRKVSEEMRVAETDSDYDDRRPIILPRLPIIDIKRVVSGRIV